MALTEFPGLNAHVTDPACGSIVFKASHNIGVAMDTPQGLLVPNIKSVQDLSVFEVSNELTRLLELGRTGKLGPADLADGTFTLSSIGSVSV